MTLDELAKDTHDRLFRVGEHYRSTGLANSNDHILIGLRSAYSKGNAVGIVEGLEIAALYHDSIADRHLAAAKWDESGNPMNGPALGVEAHRGHAAKIRLMKTTWMTKEDQEQARQA